MENTLEKQNELLKDYPQLKEAIDNSGIAEAQALEYITFFLPYIKDLTEFSAEMKNINYKDPSPEDSEKSKELRIKFMKNRTASEKMKKTLKEHSLKIGNFIQGIYNVIEKNSSEYEQTLMYAEKFTENKEIERKESLRKARALELGQYLEDVSLYPLGEISEEAYQGILQGQVAVAKQKEEYERLTKVQSERALLLFPFRFIIDESKWNLLISDNTLAKLSETDFGALLQDAERAKEEKDNQEREEREKQAKINDRAKILSALGYKFDAEKKGYLLKLTDSLTLFIFEYSLEDDEEKFSEAIDIAKIEIEKVEKLKQEAIQKRNMLRDVRLKDLKPFDYVPVNSDLIANLNQTEWEAFYNSIKTAYEDKIENIRLEEEAKKNKAELRTSRLKRLEKYGFVLSEKEIDSMLRMTNEGYDNYINTLEVGWQKQQDDLKAEQEAGMKDKEKMNSLYDLLKDFIEKAGTMEFKSKKYKNAHININLKLDELNNNIHTFLNPKK